MSISTSLPQIEPVTPPPLAPLRRPRRRARFGRRGWASAGLAVLVVLVGIGAYLGYENTLPTTVAANVTNGEKDVPTDSRVLLTFTRPTALSAVEQAFSISPATDGKIVDLGGQTQYAWEPSKPLAELTKYTVDVKPIYDVGHHRVNAAHWSFTTIIVPRVASITTSDGTVLKDGMEADLGTSLKLTFNDAMVPATINVLVGTQPAALNWAGDDRSATLSLAGLSSGPVLIHMAAGGRDQTGHLVPSGFSLQTGVYWHDHEHTIALKYPALIQIPNDEGAWDQVGLQAAGVVFEYLAEGGITRLTGVFQNAPNTIGPMRSSRYISLKLGRHYKGLLFQSGESQATRQAAAQDPTPQFFDTIGYQYRSNSRYAPDNLMINGDRVQAAENLFPGIPAYTLPKSRPDLSGGTPATSIKVDEHYSVYNYDPGTGTYSKSELGHAYRDGGLKQPLRIEMLVVLHTRESLGVPDGHGSFVHDFDLDTNGHIDVYYKGLAYSGNWASTDGHGPLTFTLANGQPITMPPGLVWIDVTA